MYKLIKHKWNETDFYTDIKYAKIITKQNKDLRIKTHLIKFKYNKII